MSSLTGVIAAIWGLLVEDGSLAVGIIVALALTWVAAALLPDPARDQIGWLLIAMLVVLVLVNLRTAAARARQHVPTPPS